MILDEKGRLFGRINIIDFIFICIVASCFGIGTGFAFFSLRGGDKIVYERKLEDIGREIRSYCQNELQKIKAEFTIAEEEYGKGFLAGYKKKGGENKMPSVTVKNLTPQELKAALEKGEIEVGDVIKVISDVAIGGDDSKTESGPAPAER